MSVIVSQAKLPQMASSARLVAVTSIMVIVFAFIVASPVAEHCPTFAVEALVAWTTAHLLPTGKGALLAQAAFRVQLQCNTAR